MLFHKPTPAGSFEILRERIDGFFSKPSLRSASSNQLALNLSESSDLVESADSPTRNATNLLGFISDALPTGELYLFGGILRDFALYGKNGFNSDIDLVVDGGWENCVPYLEYLGASLNKFGGYRLTVSGQPIDIWNARETWAIKNGIIDYNGIASLLGTTVLNWDSILMNWRTKRFVCHGNYLEEVKERALDIVLKSNPNPLGTAVKVYRHLCLKDAKKITPKAAEYLASCTQEYTFSDLSEREMLSYGNTVIEPSIYKFFEELNKHDYPSIHNKMNAATEIVRSKGITSSFKQTECDFGNQV